jgi:TRAP-type C4-dicarboxylate transport system permease small subunit
MRKVYGPLSWLERHGEEVLVLTLMWTVIGVVTVEVFRRYVLQAAGEYSEEIARLTLIWMVYLGVPYAIKRKKHIFCDVLPHGIPRKLHHAINIFADLMFLALAVLVVWYGWDVLEMQVMIDKRTNAMRIPTIFVSSAPVVGCALALIRLVQSIVLEVKEMRDDGSGPFRNEEARPQPVDG